MFIFQAQRRFLHRHKADHPKWKGPPCIVTSEEFDMECCLVWSCCLCCLFPESSVHWYHKEWPQSTNKKKKRLYLTLFMNVIIQSSQGLFHLLRAWYDKAWCLWKPRAFRNTALLNMVAVSQSPWHGTGSVTEPFVGQNLIFSGAKNRIGVVFSSFIAHSKMISAGDSSGL